MKANNFEILDPAHCYVTQDGQLINFIKRTNGDLIHSGTTNEELIEIVLNRLVWLDGKFPCQENKDALVGLQTALDALYSRTAKRVAQGVELSLIHI